MDKVLKGAKAADLQTEVNRQKLIDLQNSISRDVRISWQDTNRAYERLSVTRQLREQADLALDLAQARYNLGLGSIVEFTQAELQKTEADIADTDVIQEDAHGKRARTVSADAQFATVNHSTSRIVKRNMVSQGKEPEPVAQLGTASP